MAEQEVVRQRRLSAKQRQRPRESKAMGQLGRHLNSRAEARLGRARRRHRAPTYVL